jgi:hypothetical protein
MSWVSKQGRSDKAAREAVVPAALLSHRWLAEYN